MAKRSVPLVEGEFYHCFNRGVDKRVIFKDAEDFHYFLTALDLFNQLPTKGDMAHYKSSKRQKNTQKEPLVGILGYCLNPNHFHLLLQQTAENGVTKFMQKLCTGYTMYFNKKYDRSGSLFQGRFKAVHVEDDIQLKHLFAYVTLNNQVHSITDVRKFKNSYQEVVVNKAGNICDQALIARSFNNKADLGELTRSGIGHTIAFRKS